MTRGADDEGAAGVPDTWTITTDVLRAAHDPNLFDGRELYGPADCAELPLPDELHPDAATHRRVAERFRARVLGGGGAFAGQAPAA
uniref:hypothetical protein n=1 Tax=Georgenia wutianyii TaxID=2585135 RepID=UPI001CB71276|nr:hypothetical protein [Georgenia wutianyii]